MTLSESKVGMTGSLAIILPSEGSHSMYSSLPALVRSAESHSPGRVA
jgi:hypothetical protein